MKDWNSSNIYCSGYIFSSLIKLLSKLQGKKRRFKKISVLRAKIRGIKKNDFNTWHS